MTVPVVIFGCGAQARYVVENLRAAVAADPQAMVDIEGVGTAPVQVAGIPVRWTLDEALAVLTPTAHRVIVAHGDNGRKSDVAGTLATRGFEFVSAVHPGAFVSPSARLGRGCIVNAGAVVLVDARIGDHVIVHSGAVVEHDCVVESGANLGPGAMLAGRVRVGPRAYLYTGCTIVPGVSIGADAMVGAGAVVLHDVPDGASVVGNPAGPVNRERRSR